MKLNILRKIENVIINIAHDKMLHAFGGYVITDTMINILSHISIPYYVIASIALTVTYLCAIIKEKYDVNIKGSTRDFKDVLATVIGGIINIIISLILVV